MSCYQLFIANYRCCFQWDSFLTYRQSLDIEGNHGNIWSHRTVTCHVLHVMSTLPLGFFELETCCHMLDLVERLCNQPLDWHGEYSRENSYGSSKNGGWKTIFLLKWSIFRGHVGFWGCSSQYTMIQWISKRSRKLDCGEDVWKHEWIMGQTSSTGYIITQSFKQFLFLPFSNTHLVGGWTTHLEHMSQIGNKKNMWKNYHLVILETYSSHFVSSLAMFFWFPDSVNHH